MIRIAALLIPAALALAACNSDNSTPAPPAYPTNTTIPTVTPSNDWSIRYSPSQPNQPELTAAGLPIIAFPTASSCPQPPSSNLTNLPGLCNHVDYVTRPALPTPLTTSLTISYVVAGSCVLDYETELGNTAGDPPQLTLLLEHTGDEALNIFSYRWYSTPRGALTPGAHTLTVPLAIAHWSDVQGPPPGTAAQFEDTIANLYAVGFVLGGGNAAGHGLFCKSGSGTLTVTSFTSP